MIRNFEALWRNPTPNSPILQARNVEWETTIPPGGVSGASRGCAAMGRNTQKGWRGLISYSGVAYSEMSSPSVSVIVSDKRGVTDTETPGTHALTYLAGCRNINAAKPFNFISLASNPTDTQRRPNCQTPGGCWDFWLRPPSLHLAIPSTP